MGALLRPRAPPSRAWANNKSTGPAGARISETIDRGVLLPKVPAPLEWGPITLSSTLLKRASQLLLRGGNHVRGEALHWARQGRQGVELIATIRRVVQMARDWGMPSWLIKLDIRQALSGSTA